jgi:hypothetical protein
MEEEEDILLEFEMLMVSQIDNADQSRLVEINKVLGRLQFLASRNLLI